MDHNTLYCSFLGNYAQQILKRNISGLVSGVTNHGFYLQPDRDNTIYLSKEEHKGPLTLNLVDDLFTLKQIRSNDPVSFSPMFINFPANKIQIDLQESNIWHPPSLEGEYHFNKNHLREIIHQARKIKGEEDIFPLLEQSMSHIPAPIIGIPGIEDKLGRYFKSSENKDLELKAQKLSDLLGLGPGLTPLGDDFILGVLVILNRWGDNLFPGESFETFNRIILEKAAEKTTKISISLLNCAAVGSADERILRVLDSFFSDTELPENSIKNLLAWGSSSGIAVLAGMVSALTL